MDGPGSPWSGTSVERAGSCGRLPTREVRSLGPGARVMQHPRAAQKPGFVQPVSRKVYFSVRDSCKTCWSSSSSSRSRSSHSSSSLADSSMASCKSLSKRLLSLEAPGHRPSELVSRLSWTALWGKRGGKEQPITSSIRATAASAFTCPESTPCRALYTRPKATLPSSPL